MTIELGAVLVGLAAVISAVVGAFISWDARQRSKRAETTADEAMAASPTAILGGLRSEVQSVVDSYHEASERWNRDRENLEDDRDRERDRADASEAVVLTLRGEVALMRIDLAAARAELNELRSRFESMTKNP